MNFNATSIREVHYLWEQELPTELAKECAKLWSEGRSLWDDTFLAPKEKRYYYTTIRISNTYSLVTNRFDPRIAAITPSHKLYPIPGFTNKYKS